jgi:3-dehydroquinate dehydratase-2
MSLHGLFRMSSGMNCVAHRGVSVMCGLFCRTNLSVRWRSGSRVNLDRHGISRRRINFLVCHAHDHAYQLGIFYTNIEGEAINPHPPGGRRRLRRPGHESGGLYLRIKGAGLPYVEVHISNIAKRNIHCVLPDVAEGMITGFVLHSYILGLDAMLEILKRRTMGR